MSGIGLNPVLREMPRNIVAKMIALSILSHVGSSSAAVPLDDQIAIASRALDAIEATGAHVNTFVVADENDLTLTGALRTLGPVVVRRSVRPFAGRSIPPGFLVVESIRLEGSRATLGATLGPGTLAQGASGDAPDCGLRFDLELDFADHAWNVASRKITRCDDRQ